MTRDTPAKPSWLLYVLKRHWGALLFMLLTVVTFVVIVYLEIAWQRPVNAAAATLLPLVIAFVGWKASDAVSRYGVGHQYVDLAMTILRASKSDETVKLLRPWAVDLINHHSEVKLGNDIAGQLREGTLLFPVAMPHLNVSIAPLVVDLQSGATQTLVISITNPSTQDARDVIVTVDLPEECELVDAQGPTSYMNTPPFVVFGALPTLAPKSRVEYRVQCRTSEQGAAVAGVKVDAAAGCYTSGYCRFRVVSQDSSSSSSAVDGGV